MKFGEEKRIPYIFTSELEEALQIRELPKKREALEKATHWDDSATPFRHIIWHMGSEEPYYNNERARKLLSDTLVELADGRVYSHDLFSQLLEFVPSGKESYMIETATRILTKNHQLYDDKEAMGLIREKTISLIKRVGITDYQFVKNAAKLLGEVGGRESVETVISLMRKLRDLPTLYACIDALKKIGQDNPRPAILALKNVQAQNNQLDNRLVIHVESALQTIKFSISGDPRPVTSSDLAGLDPWDRWKVSRMMSKERIENTPDLTTMAMEMMGRGHPIKTGRAEKVLWEIRRISGKQKQAI